MSSTGRYRSPDAMRTALEMRIVAAAKQGGFGVNERRRQYAFNRFLARVFTSDPDRWCLKGGVALLARVPEARHSSDVDLRCDATSVNEAVSALQAAVTVDLGDWFEFDVADRVVPLCGENRTGGQVKVTARLGKRAWESFSVDLVCSPGSGRSPETVPPYDPVGMPDVNQPGSWRVYPICEHVADKVAATLERHGNQRNIGSTRTRDLVDLGLIARTCELDATELSGTIRRELARRHITVPARFDVPNSEWERRYPTDANRSALMSQVPFAECLADVQAMLDPVLTGTVTEGLWIPEERRWHTA